MTRLARIAFLSVSLSVVSLLLVGTLRASAGKAEADATDSPYKYLSVFMEVLSLATKAYVDEPPTSTLMAGAFEGSIDALDPFSLYVPSEAVAAYVKSREIGSRHSGLLLLKERGVAYVVAVAAGSPAAKAGLEAGDILSEVAGKRTRETPLYEIHALLSGPAGTKLACERLRLGQKSRCEIVLGEYPPPAVEVKVARGVPVLRIGGFHAGTVADVRQSLQTVKKPGELLPGLEVHDKLILDLRSVAGGNERVAYEVAGLFAQGELGALFKRKEKVETFKAVGEPQWQGTIFLLVDRGTQGAAEVLATTLRQAVKARLVGERSFGHAGQVGLVDLADGGRLQLTTAFFTGPDGVLMKDSLEPDERIRASFEDEAAADAQTPPKDEVLEHALDVLLAKVEPAPAVA